MNEPLGPSHEPPRRRVEALKQIDEFSGGYTAELEAGAEKAPSIFRFSMILNYLRFGANFFSREGMILLLYVVAAASTLDNEMRIRGLEEGSPRYGLEVMLDGSADLPFVKRQLLPQIANRVADFKPFRNHAGIYEYRLEKYELKEAYYGKARYKEGEPGEWTPTYAVKYHIIYLLMFCSLLGTLYALRWLGLALLPRGNRLAVLLPVAFVMLLPLTFMHGSFMYDFTELFFLAALLLSAARGWYFWWLILLPVAVINKETAILAPLLYAPLILINCRTWAQRVPGLVSLVIAGGVFWFIGHTYAGNAGGTTEWHLAKNVDFWTDLSNYKLWHAFIAPVILMPRGFNLLLFGVLACLIYRKGRSLSPVLYYLFGTAAVINLPLFFLFTYRDETRNLSMLFIPLYLLVAYAVLAPDRKASRGGDIPAP